MKEQFRLSKSIFEYDNYRVLLRDFYEAAKGTRKTFSFRVFSRMAGFQSSGSIFKVINGQKNLSREGALKLAKALRLNMGETHFFVNLVLHNQARSMPDKMRYAEEIMKSKSYKRSNPLKPAQFHFYSKWYFGPIRELVCFPDFKEDPQWIASKLSPPISPSEAKRALEEMIELELLVRNEEGKLVQAASHITSGDEIVFSSAPRAHQEILNISARAIDTVPREKRDISSVTLGITEETAGKVKELVQEFRSKVVEVCSQDSSVNTVYFLNIQLLPVTK